MTVGSARTTKDAAGTAPGTGPPRARAPRPLRLRGALALLAAAAALALAAGFLRFIAHVADDEIALDRDADGIVVLTGGASRIADAIELLAARHGQRLLISGVNPTTHSGGIARLMPLYGEMFACCIDLDHSFNTIGNAIETRRWAKAHGFASLIVVTSNYHMPRAMAELAYQLPDATLIAFPVVPDKWREEPWWANYSSARLLFTEYLKYIFALMRHRLDRTPTELARA
jgi:uncharacterized SAM-binding protein YcdF (DUF218 family)